MLATTTETLRLISAYPGDLTTVLQGILAKAAEFCGGEAGSITLDEGDFIRYVASHGPAMQPYIGTRWKRDLLAADWFSISPSGVVHIADFAAATKGNVYFEELATVARVRSYAAVPLTADGAVVGAVHMYRHELRPFGEDELTALVAFGEQASLAVANARLFNQLDESLLRQQAMGDVLDAVSTARVDLQPVFQRIAEHAGRLCNGSGAMIFVREGDGVLLAATSSAVAALWEHGPLDDTSASGESILTGRVISIPDWAARPADQYPLSPVARSYDGEVLAVPMLRDGTALGAITFSRPKRGGYTDAEIALLPTFANQAAIAVDNARLLREIERRNNDLDESLELKTATSEVLALISAHLGDLISVMNGLINRAVRLCDADAGVVWRFDADSITFLANPQHPESVGSSRPPVVAELKARLSAGEPVRVDDMLANSMPGREVPEDVRSFVAVGLRVDGELYGILGVNRYEVRPFDEREANILNAFGEQAAIAIGNARLFNDLDESLARQRAMTDVLDAVSTARFDLQPVFDRIVAHANRLCGNRASSVVLRHGDRVQIAALEGGDVSKLDWVWSDLNETSIGGAAILSGKAITIDDWDNRPADQFPNSSTGRTTGSELALIPMLRDGAAVGAIGVGRPMRGGYTEAEIALLQTFANQAAIAVDNARLLRQIEQRNAQLGESLELQTATSEILALISANPGDLRKVFDGIVAQAARLCDADGASINRLEGDELVLQATSYEHLQANVGHFRRPSLRGQNWSTIVHFVDDMTALGPEVPAEIRSCLLAPLIVDGEPYGLLNLNRREVRPFEPRHGRIAQVFAEQAAIAISNAKLFNDLDAALALQTAMAEVLRLISAHPGELTTVLEGILAQARTLCDADQGFVILIRDDGTAVVAAHDYPTAPFAGRVFPAVERLQSIDRPLMRDDVQAELAADDHTRIAEFVRETRNRSVMVVPLVRQGKHLGNFHLGRREVRPFVPA